jgi:hypothetical protein
MPGGLAPRRPDLLPRRGAAGGAWPAGWPRSFYDDFPWPGHPWVAPLGAYNEHLLRDFGGMNLAMAVVFGSPRPAWTGGWPPPPWSPTWSLPCRTWSSTVTIWSRSPPSTRSRRSLPWWRRRCCPCSCSPSSLGRRDRTEHNHRRPVGNQLDPRATLPGRTPDAEPADQPDHRSGAPARPAASANCSSADSGPSASRARIARHPLGNAARATHAVSAGICLSPSGRSDIANFQPSRPSQPIDPKAPAHRPEGQRWHTDQQQFASRVHPEVVQAA